MNRWIASGPINEIEASANANSGPGTGVIDLLGAPGRVSRGKLTS
jgi:hypothetical protein